MSDKDTSNASVVQGFETRVTQVTVVRKDKPLFDESATVVTIEPEVGGEYLYVQQCGNDQELGRIAVDSTDWPGIRDAIDAMMQNCREYPTVGNATPCPCCGEIGEHKMSCENREETTDKEANQ